MAKEREVSEGTQYQGVDEIIAYTLTTTNVGSSPSSVSAVVKTWVDGAAGTDVTATVMPTGSISVSGDIITLKPLKLLTAGTLYRVEVKYDIGGNTVESYFYVLAEV